MHNTALIWRQKRVEMGMRGMIVAKNPALSESDCFLSEALNASNG